MDKDGIVNVIKETISKETEIPEDEIMESSLLMRDLELSSLEVIMIIGILEEKFSVRSDVNEMQKIATVGDLADYFCDLLKDEGK